MITFSVTQNYNTQNRLNFRGYTPQQICSELCKGACCNHGTNMNATLKKIADKLCAQYRTLPDDLKSTALIKAPIVKWVVYSENPEINTLTKLANIYIDAISKEKDPKRIAQLAEELDKINQKLVEIDKNQEYFLPVTNPAHANSSREQLAYENVNICMFKDHNNTNLCTIYHGIKNDEGKIISSRPSPCLHVGGKEMPCPWLNPEKYREIFEKVVAKYKQFGFSDVPENIVQRYIINQFNLNDIFFEKIWKPYVNSLNK